MFEERPREVATIKTNMRSLLVLVAAWTLLRCDWGSGLSGGPDTPGAIDKFCAKFAKEIDDGDKNKVSSGLSAGITLGLFALGSSGETHDEILTTLALPNDKVLRTRFSDLVTQLQEVKGVTFKIANKVYVNDSGTLYPDFKSVAEDVFHTEVELINFVDGAKVTRIINTWMKGKTNNKIDQISPETYFDATTLTVNVNGLYFKGRWKTQFDSKETNITKFRVDSSKTSEVPFMRINGHFRYGESDRLNAKLVELPFEGEEASMLVVLPNAADGLTELLHKLANWVSLEEELMKITTTVQVCVCLPRFKIETKIVIDSVLVKLGVRSLFEKYQLNKMVRDSSMRMSNMIHKTVIEVDEEGAEPANVIVGYGDTVKIQKHLVADHPFLAVVKIRDSFALWATVRDP